MLSSLKKMRGDKKGWYKVSDLRPGVEIAVPSEKNEILWDEIVSIKPVGREQVYDIEVEETHNFIGNNIFAHNTYVLRANTMLAVEGLVVPMPTLPSDGSPSSALLAEIPTSVLTADGKGVDLYKLATYNLSGIRALSEKVDGHETRLVSLETRVDALESGAISSASGTPTFSTSTLASAFEGLGVLIQKGIAQFNTLVFRQLVASKDADGTSSAGSVSILTGNTVAQVSNSMVKPSTKVFVTFNSQIAGSWWVSDKADGSFRIILSEAQAGDVSFDYFLVQTEGQIATSSPMTDGAYTRLNLVQNDTTAPVVTLLGDNPIYLSIGGTFIEPGLNITDENQTTINTFVNGIQQEANADTITTGSQTTYIITYEVVDSAGNSATARRSVIVGSTSFDSAQDESLTTGGEPVDSEPQTPSDNSGGGQASSDTTAPVVTLNGAAAMHINVGDAFTDPGATASDDIDGTIATVVTGTVDTTIAGLYTLTYTATDAAGNVGTASRVVTVVDSTISSQVADPVVEPAPATP